jgi:very-short-patch-repair endonuclease
MASIPARRLYARSGWNRLTAASVKTDVLTEYLRQQDGVITLAQATLCGLSESAVNRRVRSGQWRRCASGVYFVDDRPFTAAARVRTAVWSYGGRATASGLTAAWWHGVTKRPPDIVEITVPRNSHGRCHEGTRVRRRDLEPTDIVDLRGLRVTSLPLTVIEAAARQGGGAAIIDRALQRHIDLPPMWRAHVRNKGRYGSPRARILLQAAGDGAQSQAERLFIQLLKRAGITGWTANYPVGPYRVDVAFPQLKVAIEVDGLAVHSDAEVFQTDRERQNYLVLNGWHVLRFTWRDLTEHPERVIAELRRAISAR